MSNHRRSMNPDERSRRGAAEGVTRRTLLQTLALTGGALSVGGISAGALAGKGGGKGPPPRYPLRIPPVVSPAGLSLHEGPTVTDLANGDEPMTMVWGYNSQFPAPTIVANRGDLASIHLTNGLQQETITHWHGMIVPHDADGHPRQAVPPGGSYQYNFAIDQRACLNWYHPHPHMHTGEQVFMGLAGAFVIRDAEEAALGLPSGSYELPLIIRDVTLDARGNFKFSTKSSGFFGQTPLVNGTLSPFVEVDRAVYRLRVLNGCNARVMWLALDSGAPFTLIGTDGGLLPVAVPMQQITIGPAERLDLIVDFRALAEGSTVMLRDVGSGWDLLEFRGTGQAGGGSVPTGPLSSITPLPAPVRERYFSFEGMTRINGQRYDLNRIDFQVPLGECELWRFETNGNGPHPVHVHGAYFQVVGRQGGRGRLYPWEAGWKDTVLVGDGETVEVLIRFDEFRGLYLIHCHQLAHEDAGMMANFEVV